MALKYLFLSIFLLSFTITKVESKEELANDAFWACNENKECFLFVEKNDKVRKFSVPNNIQNIIFENLLDRLYKSV